MVLEVKVMVYLSEVEVGTKVSSVWNTRAMFYFLGCWLHGCVHFLKFIELHIIYVLYVEC